MNHTQKSWYKSITTSVSREHRKKYIWRHVCSRTVHIRNQLGVWAVYELDDSSKYQSTQQRMIVHSNLSPRSLSMPFMLSQVGIPHPSSSMVLSGEKTCGISPQFDSNCFRSYICTCKSKKKFLNLIPILYLGSLERKECEGFSGHLLSFC